MSFARAALDSKSIEIRQRIPQFWRESRNRQIWRQLRAGLHSNSEHLMNCGFGSIRRSLSLVINRHFAHRF